MRRLLLLQLDGLSGTELERNWALMPNLNRLYATSHRLHTMFSGLPSTTPAFQGEFFYGVRQCVPAWYFREAANGKLAQLIQRPVSLRRERQLARRGTGLLSDGAAYTCLVSGGASQVHFGAGQSQLQHLGHLLALWPHSLRVAGRGLGEMLRGLSQAWSGAECARDELLFLPKRALLHALMNEYFRTFLPRDMRRGVPVLYANFLSYDCLAHLRGPHSAYARQALPEIDRVVGELAEVASTYGYQIWIFSDHGQETTTPYDWRGSGVLARRLGLGSVSADHGPVAHLYFEGGDRRELAERLVSRHQVPQVMFCDHLGVQVYNSRGIFRLPQEWPEVLGPDHPFGPEAALDLARMAHHPEAGRLVALGFFHDLRVTFLREYGSHGGAAPLETEAFALLPEEVELRRSARGLAGPLARPLDLRRAVLAQRGLEGPLENPRKKAPAAHAHPPLRGTHKRP